MEYLSMFLWFCIISSGIVIFGYEIWNFIVVAKDLAIIAKEGNKE